MEPRSDHGAETKPPLDANGYSAPWTTNWLPRTLAGKLR